MVFETEDRPQNKEHPTDAATQPPPTASASPSTITAWRPMPGYSCRPPWPSISAYPNWLTDASPSTEPSSYNPIQDEATKTADGAVTPAKIANMNGPNGLVLAAGIIWPIYARHQRERFAPF